MQTECELTISAHCSWLAPTSEHQRHTPWTGRLMSSSLPGFPWSPVSGPTGRMTSQISTGTHGLHSTGTHNTSHCLIPVAHSQIQTNDVKCLCFIIMRVVL